MHFEWLISVAHSCRAQGERMRAAGGRNESVRGGHRAQELCRDLGLPEGGAAAGNPAR